MAINQKLQVYKGDTGDNVDIIARDKDGTLIDISWGAVANTEVLVKDPSDLSTITTLNNAGSDIVSVGTVTTSTIRVKKDKIGALTATDYVIFTKVSDGTRIKHLKSLLDVKPV